MNLRWLTIPLALLTTGCLLNPPSSTVVNAGDSTPIKDREDGIAWEGVPDRTSVVAYEVGHCESDADCIPRGCDQAVCSPEGMLMTCVTTPVGSCLAKLGSHACGCNEGVCRWARTPKVLQCAAIEAPRTGTRPFYGGGGEGKEYPYPPAW